MMRRKTSARALVAWAVVACWALLWPSLAQARDYMSDAHQALQKGDLKTAQIQLRNAVKEDPQNAEARFQLARVDMLLGDAAAAQREATAARDRGYDQRKVIPLLAQTYMVQGKTRELLHDFTVGNSDPALDAQILVARGYAQAAQRDIPAAEASFAQAERLAPEAMEPLAAQFRVAVAKGDLATAQVKVDRALSLQPKNQEALLEKVQLLHRKGEIPAALTAADDLVATAPGFPDGRLERATLLLASGNNDKAKEDLAAVLAALPNNPRALLLEALLQARQKDLAGADATLQRISPVMANLPRGYFLLAYVKAQLGQWEQAEDAAQRYVARAPDDLAGLKLLAGIEMQRQRPDRVIESLAKPAAAGVGDAATYDLLGRAYSASGQQDAATQAFEKAAALAPDDPNMRGRLAASRLAAGDPNAAVADLEKALEIAPKQASVGAALFFAELATGDLDRAAAAVEQLRKVQGDTPVVQNIEGLLKLARLDIPGARAQFQKVVDTAPDFTPARVNLARIAAMDGQHDEAVGLLKAILDKEPASEPALGMYVAAESADGKTAEAADALQHARSATPTDTRLTVALADLYSRTGDGKGALSLLADDPQKLAASPVLLAAQARAQLALGQTADARNSYMRILAIDPRAIDARQQLIALAVQANEFEAARNLVQEGLRASPENLQLLTDYIAIDNKDGGLQKALATADRLRAQVGDTPQARALKGDVYLAARQFDPAATEYADQLKQSPSTFMLLRLVAAQLAGGHPDAAKQALNDWVGKNPKDVPALEALSGLELGQQDFAEAERQLNAILAVRPRDPIALNNLAWLYQKRNDPRARDLAQQAYLLLPGGQTADTLGWILVKQGAAGTALPLLRQASSQLSSNPEVKYHLAAALNDTGQHDAARKLLTALLDDKQDFTEKPDAQKLLDTLSKG